METLILIEDTGNVAQAQKNILSVFKIRVPVLTGDVKDFAELVIGYDACVIVDRHGGPIAEGLLCDDGCMTGILPQLDAWLKQNK